MSDGPSPTPPEGTLRSESGIPLPNPHPYSDVTFACVVWNDAKRLEKLLVHVAPYFEHVAVVVQESPDDTLEVARRHATIVLQDAHSGYGDSSFGPVLLPAVPTRWTLKLDADEWPTVSLLDRLGTMAWFLEHYDSDGLWIPFRSVVEGGEYKEQHSHMRLFETSLGWPAALHSRPPTKRDRWWAGRGYIRHVRSLDEMMRDYLNYFRIGRGNRSWEDHNRMMMNAACSDAARRKGWAFVQAFSWWPDVEAIAFAEDKPWLQQ